MSLLTWLEVIACVAFVSFCCGSTSLSSILLKLSGWTVSSCRYRYRWSHRMIWYLHPLFFLFSEKEASDRFHDLNAVLWATKWMNEQRRIQTFFWKLKRGCCSSFRQHGQENSGLVRPKEINYSPLQQNLAINYSYCVPEFWAVRITWYISTPALPTHFPILFVQFANSC